MLKPATLRKVKRLHGCFSRFLKCTNVIKLRKTSHILSWWSGQCLLTDKYRYFKCSDPDPDKSLYYFLFQITDTKFIQFFVSKIKQISNNDAKWKCMFAYVWHFYLNIKSHDILSNNTIFMLRIIFICLISTHHFARGFICSNIYVQVINKLYI